MSAPAVPLSKPGDAAPGGAKKINYLNISSGFFSWALTLDHKRIGLMYLVAVTSAFFLGGVFALLIRLELLFPNRTIMSGMQYNHVFTLHGAIMVFLFIIPAIPGSLGNFVLPVMLGAKDVAFPRLNLCSFYLWILGAVCFLATLVFGGLDTGWTFYTPYSTQPNGSTTTGIIFALMGAFILGFSSIFTGLNFMVTMHTLRPPGMTWFKMPLFLWALYSTSLIQVLATPVLGITLLLLMCERALGIGIFDPRYGGDPVLFQHFFWFYSHPAVYIMILPGMGVISELIATFSRNRIFGYKFIAYSSVAIAIFGFLVWAHHMFTSGQSRMSAMIFSALTFSVSIPSAVKVFNWVATLYKGSISLEAPMCYGLAFVFLFTIGGLTGLPLGALKTDVHLHDTYFVVAHFHYVMMGSTAIAFFGGLHYWWPKMTGKMYHEGWARLCCLGVFVGFNLTFIPQFVMGSLGMPRRYYTYHDEFWPYHATSTAGALLLGFSLLGAIVVLLVSLWKGKDAPDNPWGAATLEWQCSSPPPLENFKDTPIANDPYELESVVYVSAEEGYRFDRELSKKNAAIYEASAH